MNILVTGSPGVGKSTFSKALQANIQSGLNISLQVLSVSDLVKAEKLYEEYDEELQTYIMDDPKVKRRLKSLLANPGWIIESHTLSIIPRKLIDHVFILRVPNTAVYYDRLAARGYPPLKIEENVDCEIMQVVWQEAVELFGEDSTSTMVSETESQLVDSVKEAIEILQEK